MMENNLDSIELSVFAMNLARKNNQVVGEKNDLYITLEQLSVLLSIYQRPMNEEIVRLKENYFKKPLRSKWDIEHTNER